MNNKTLVVKEQRCPQNHSCPSVRVCPVGALSQKGKQSKMKIDIIRGENQIGGNIIEISTSNAKILLDIGLELDDEKNKTLPEIKGLFDEANYDGVFISHYHGDHLGLAYHINKAIPLYIGEASYKIIKASDNYKQVETITPTGYLKHKQPIQIKDIKITPYLCDHSAFDSYMLFIEADGENVLYTGDFRSNGRKSYEWILKELPKNVDNLICEGTTLTRKGIKNETEKELEERAVKLLKSAKGPIFIMQSSMNIDRIVTIYRSAKRSGRVLLQDLYMAEITSSIGASIPNPVTFSDVKVFVTRYYEDGHYRKKLFDNYINKVGKNSIKNLKFVMCVRNSMINYLKSLNKEISFENGILIYSFWDGYKEQDEMKKFLLECESMGLKIETLHTSGHADEAAIKKLIRAIKPKNIIPIHTENAEWFDLFKKN